MNSKRDISEVFSLGVVCYQMIYMIIIYSTHAVKLSSSVISNAYNSLVVIFIKIARNYGRRNESRLIKPQCLLKDSSNGNLSLFTDDKVINDDNKLITTVIDGKI